jgi:hypothetical protein
MSEKGQNNVTKSEQGENKVRTRSVQGQYKVSTRSVQGQYKVKTRSKQGQNKVRKRSEQWQNNIRTRSKQGPWSSQRTFSTAVIWEIDLVLVGAPATWALIKHCFVHATGLTDGNFLFHLIPFTIRIIQKAGLMTLLFSDFFLHQILECGIFFLFENEWTDQQNDRLSICLSIYFFVKFWCPDRRTDELPVCLSVWSENYWYLTKFVIVLFLENLIDGLTDRQTNCLSLYQSIFTWMVKIFFLNT